MNWFSKLSAGLKKTTESLGAVLTKRKLDAASLEELEESLILSDMGTKAAMEIIAELSRDRFDKDIGEDELKELLAGLIANRLAVAETQEMFHVKQPSANWPIGTRMRAKK